MQLSARDAHLPAEWPTAVGFVGFRAHSSSYAAGAVEKPDLPDPQPVALREIRPPMRDEGVVGLVEERALSILRAMAAGRTLPPVTLYAAPEGSYRYRLIDGFHRYSISVALGFDAIPASVLDYWEPWMTGDPMP